MEFFEAWKFLLEHKMFNGCFEDILYIMVVKVNPETNEIDDDNSKNIKTEVWLECGPWSAEYNTHDWDLDCGGDTFEEAVIRLAGLVKKWYDDDGVKNQL